MRLTTSAALLGFSLMKNSSGLGMLPAAGAREPCHPVCVTVYARPSVLIEG